MEIKFRILCFKSRRFSRVVLSVWLNFLMIHHQSQFLKYNKHKNLKMTTLNFSKIFTIPQVSLPHNRPMIPLILLECHQVPAEDTKLLLHTVEECRWIQEVIWEVILCKTLWAEWAVRCRIRWVEWEEDPWEECLWEEEWTLWCLPLEEAMVCNLNLECMEECSKTTTQAMGGSQQEVCKQDLAACNNLLEDSRHQLLQNQHLDRILLIFSIN